MLYVLAAITEKEEHTDIQRNKREGAGTGFERALLASLAAVEPARRRWWAESVPSFEQLCAVCVRVADRTGGAGGTLRRVCGAKECAAAGLLSARRDV